MNRRSKKLRTRRPRSSSKLLDFQTLEPRQLLAGDLAAPHQVAATLPTDVNIVVNGDFESFTAGADNFYTEAEVPGWKAMAADDGQEFNIINYSADYGSVLDLDSTVAQFDIVYQDIATQSGQQYLIAFDFRAHPAANASPTARSYDFEVWWNHELIAVYTSTDIWQTGSLLVEGSNSATTELLICEISEGTKGGGDGLGALLDNIRVMEAVESPIVNGSFETTVAGKVQFFRPFEVAGWGAMGTDVATRLIKIEQAAPGALVGPSLGLQFLNLDTTATHRDIVFQDIDTVVDGSYYVTFDARADGNLTNHTDDFRVRWNNSWATTIHPDGDWQRYGILVEADAVESRLTFLEPGDGSTGEGSGPWIDNVMVFRVDPAAVNEAPQIENIADRAADFGQAISLAVVATDPEADDIAYSISHAGITAGNNVPTISNSGQISWTPSHAGAVDLTVTATDILGKASSKTFKVTVGNFVPFAGTHALSGIPTALRNNIYTAAPDIKINTAKNFEARFNTNNGIIKFNLFASQAPKTVNNFVLLARDGFYDGVELHRVLAGFVAQGGDPLGTGTGGPGYTFADETSNGLIFDTPNVLAMANSGPNTNGSQFFFTFGTPTSLNGNHTIFGEVVGDATAFTTSTITHDVAINGQEIPRTGITKTVINSVTIHVT